MRSGAAILIGMVPRIVTKLLDVWAAPFLGVVARWRINEDFQAFIGGGVAIHVDVKSFNGRFEFGDVRLGGTDLGLLAQAHDLRNNRRGQNAEDHDDHHEFNQRESLRAFFYAMSFHFSFWNWFTGSSGSF